MVREQLISQSRRDLLSAIQVDRAHHRKSEPDDPEPQDNGPLYAGAMIFVFVVVALSIL